MFANLFCGISTVYFSDGIIEKSPHFFYDFKREQYDRDDCFSTSIIMTSMITKCSEKEVQQKIVKSVLDPLVIEKMTFKNSLPNKPGIQEKFIPAKMAQNLSNAQNKKINELVRKIKKKKKNKEQNIIFLGGVRSLNDESHYFLFQIDEEGDVFIYQSYINLYSLQYTMKHFKYMKEETFINYLRNLVSETQFEREEALRQLFCYSSTLKDITDRCKNIKYDLREQILISFLDLDECGYLETIREIPFFQESEGEKTLIHNENCCNDISNKQNINQKKENTKIRSKNSSDIKCNCNIFK